VGTITSREEGFAIFLDQSTKVALRLKIGEDYRGWTLRSIRGREATVEKDKLAIILEMPQPSVGQAFDGVHAQLLSMPASTQTNKSGP
jgi:general secretion pathway protein N